MYSFTCTCGETHLVDSAQAGQSVTCSCGKELEVPSLRGLRRLATSAEIRVSPGRGLPQKKWSRAQAWIFGAGVILLVLATVVGGYGLFVWRVVNTERPVVQTDDPAYSAHVNRLSPVEVYSEWEHILRAGPPQYAKPAFVINRQVSALGFQLFVGGCVAFFMALVLMAISLALRPAYLQKAKA